MRKHEPWSTLERRAQQAIPTGPLDHPSSPSTISQAVGRGESNSNIGPAKPTTKSSSLALERETEPDSCCKNGFCDIRRPAYPERASERERERERERCSQSWWVGAVRAVLVVVLVVVVVVIRLGD